MNFPFIAYIFISIAIGLGVPMKLFQSGRMWSAVLFLVLAVFIFIFFGIRWFSTSNVVGSYTGSWPPIINTCPDYLVYFKKGNQDTCIDLIGVNRSGGSLAPWSQDDTPKSPPQANNKYFYNVYKAGMGNGDLQILCDQARQYGLTWEGITNGESCSFASPAQVLGPNGSVINTACPSIASTLGSQLNAISTTAMGN